MRNQAKRKKNQVIKKVLSLINDSVGINYFTCSVFKAENIGVLKVLAKHLAFKVNKSELLTGYNHQADTLFVATISRF